VLSDKPENIQKDDFIDKLYENLDDKKTYNVLQISDWHIDLEYVEGTVIECNGMICCQDRYGKTINGARKYGEYRCDFPLEGAKAQMKWMRENLTGDKKPEVIIWTGDSLSH
jgi:sphingomyelin phosphodiesterase